jgi:hypothetical protein
MTQGARLILPDGQEILIDELTFGLRVEAIPYDNSSGYVSYLPGTKTFEFNGNGRPSGRVIDPVRAVEDPIIAQHRTRRIILEGSDR